MARNFTLGQLATKVRQRGDYLEQDDNYDDSFIDNTLLYDFIDSAYTELYDKLVASNEAYYMSQTELSITAGVGSASLPTDFYKSLGIDAKDSNGDWRQVGRMNWHERGSGFSGVTSTAWVDRMPWQYQIEGSNLRLYETPDTDVDIRLSYIPIAPKLTGSAQSIDGINGFEELVVLYSLRRCKAREQMSTTEVDREIVRQEARIQKMSRERDAGEPKRLADPRYVQTQSRQHRR